MKLIAMSVAALVMTTAPVWAQSAIHRNGRSSTQLTTRRAGQVTTTAPSTRAATRPTTTVPATGPTATRPRPYTAPGAQFRAGPLGTAAGLLAVAAPAVTGGRELSEASVSRPLAATTRMLGLGASNTGYRNATLSTRGLQEALPTYLGRAASNNLLTARPNPATGPVGVCNQVRGAGFTAGPNFCGLPRR